MRFLIVLPFLFSSLFAFGENIQSFEADFVQTITDEEKKTLVYKGNMHSKRPDLVFWHYVEPINKKIYLTKTKAVIVEPELEQATIKRLQGEIDFFGILASAKAIDGTHYKARYKDIEFILKEEDGVITSLSYTDQLENHVLITFSAQKQNRLLEDSLFTPKVPQDYDIIRN